MIVVGVLAPSDSRSDPRPAGGAGARPASDAVLEIARRAAATGARTEVVGVAPAGAAGDRQLVQLAGAGIGHATVTRSAATGIESADLDLALRYLPDIRAIVLVQPEASLLSTAFAASSWSGATLVVVGPLAADAATALDEPALDPLDPSSDRPDSSASRPAPPIVLDPPARDPDGAFTGLVAALAVRLDAGEDPAHAWQSTVSALAIDPV